MAGQPSRVAVVTGAGSGVGRATALRLAGAGWTVAMFGRRPEALAGTAASASGTTMVCPCDVTDARAVAAQMNQVLARHDRIDTLVHCAGINVAARAWSQLSTEDYRKVLAANLDGAFHCIHSVLPAMRAQGGGTIVVINSEAGRQASVKSGPAYVASKFGLTGLVQSLNAEERIHGIRACSVFPGDVNTPLLDRRPVPPDEQARHRMVQPADVAECVWLVISLPSRATIEELVVRPTQS